MIIQFSAECVTIKSLLSLWAVIILSWSHHSKHYIISYHAKPLHFDCSYWPLPTAGLCISLETLDSWSTRTCGWFLPFNSRGKAFENQEQHFINPCWINNSSPVWRWTVVSIASGLPQHEQFNTRVSGKLEANQYNSQSLWTPKYRSYMECIVVHILIPSV